MPSKPERPLIAFCDAYSVVYGAQRSLLQLYERWHREERYRLLFLYLQPGHLVDEVTALGIKATQLPVGSLLGSYDKRLLRLRAWDYPKLALEAFAYSRNLRRILTAQGVALLHCNNDRTGLMNFAAARWAGCPVVNHVRRDRSFGWRDRVIHAGASQMIWVSRRVRDDFSRNHGIERPKGRVIYNGRELPDRNEPATNAEIRREFGLPPDARVALVAASYDVRKDHETLVRAAGIACQADTRLFILVAGADLTPGQERWRKIEGLIAEAGLSRRVLLLGQRDDVGRLMRGSDILINPAREEALGGALIEAMAYGLPCVATDTGGTAEIVPPDRCGYLVPRQDADQLAQRAIDLVSDEATRQRFSQNAREHFDAHFTVDRCAEATAEFFDDIIARRRPI